MPTFSAPDGTRLAYHLAGAGRPVICLPGGPMLDSAYLGDFGGLSAHRQLVVVDLRGTGQSAIPADAASYHCDRVVGDVEALREHLGLDRVDLLAHSAGANLAALYVARHPGRVGKLALIAPSTRAVGIETTGPARLQAARLRQDEPWFTTAYAALNAVVAGHATDAEWQAIDPFFHGRWDEATQAYQAAQDLHRNAAAAAVFGADGVFDPPATRAALAAFDAPVLLLAGALDLNTPPDVAAAFAALFPAAKLVVQPAAGHYPWRDDADQFVATTTAFLG